MACISQISDPRQEITSDDKFTITAHTFSRLFGVTKNSAYSDLSESATSLLTRVVTIESPDPDNPKLSRTKTTWISVADYYDGEGKVVVQFVDRIIPYLSNLKNGCFTKYRIEKIAKIKSVYAIRIYELLISESWKKKDYEIEVLELKEMFNIDKSEYNRIFDLKRFIIEPAISSINKHTDISVAVSYRKTGRTVTHIVFKYSVKINKKTKSIQSKPLIPVFTGYISHDDDTDTESVLAQHEALKAKTVPSTKPLTDEIKKNISILKNATKGITK